MKKLYNGFFAVCDAVKHTLGAEGRLAVIRPAMMGMPPLVTKDGVTVAKNIHFADDEESMGATLAKQVAIRTLAKVGDNTTTALVLAKEIIDQTDNYFFNKKTEKGLEIAFEEICEKMKEIAKPTDDEAVKRIATISSNNNEEIGNVIFDAYKFVGDNGIIDIKEVDSSTKISFEPRKGLRFEKGWSSPFLINNERSGTFEAEDALVIVYEGYEIHNNNVVKKFINENKNKPIVIVVERLGQPEWVDTLYRFSKQSGCDITLIEAPEFDKKRTALLEDLAVYTGAEIFSQNISNEIKAGIINKVIVEQNATYFIQKELNKETEHRISVLKSNLETTTEKEFFQKRIQNFNGVSATIMVGGITPEESRERFDRVDDAVKNIKSSISEGYVAGGGSAFVFISNTMNKVFDNEHTQKGYNILKEAIKKPYLQICENARVDGRQFIDKIQKEYGVGYNAKTDELSNMFTDGVIDSTKSLRVALENAKAQSILLLNTAVVIV